MASWLESLFGTCCGRHKPPSGELQKAASSHLSQELANEEDLHSLPSLSVVPETEAPVSYSLPQSPILSFPSPTPISQKSTLTSQQSSLDSTFPLLNQMNCGDCEQRSTGFCIGCQKRRYCYSCFQTVHNSMHGVHKFISYAGVRRVVKGKEERKV